MEVTINLPEQIFANLTVIAGKSHRPLNEVIVEKIEQSFATETATLSQQFALCSDQDVLALAKLQMPAQQDERLRELLQKQGEATLSANEQNELWKLMEINRLTTLKKAFALREISRRGLHEQN